MQTPVQRQVLQLLYIMCSTLNQHLTCHFFPRFFSKELGLNFDATFRLFDATGQDLTGTEVVEDSKMRDFRLSSWVVFFYCLSMPPLFDFIVLTFAGQKKKDI